MLMYAVHVFYQLDTGLLPVWKIAIIIVVIVFGISTVTVVIVVIVARGE